MKSKNRNVYGLRRNQHLIRSLTLITLILCLQPLIFNPNLLHAQSQSASANTNTTNHKTAEEIEYEVKAAFIYNFMKFVEWPNSKKKLSPNNPQKNEPMTVGILGNNPFGKAFDPLLTKKVGNRPIQVIEIESFKSFQKKHQSLSKAIQAYENQYQETFRKCEIVFISNTEKLYMSELLELLSEQAILTVSDLPEFAEKGGIVGFVIDNKKVRFEINLNSAKRENLQIRSQLLRLARRVYK